MAEKIIALFFAFAIFGQAYLFRVHTRTWLAPGCLYGLFWFAYTAIPLIVAPIYQINPWAIFYIFLTCTLYSVSALAFDWKGAIKINKLLNPKFNYNTKLINRSFYALGFSAILSTVINWGLQGISYYDILFNLLDAGGEYMGKRYSGDLQTGVASQLSIVLTYPTAILGGLLYGSRPKNDGGIRFVVIAVASAILMMLVEAAKGALFLVLILFWAGLLLANINRGKIKYSIGRGFIFQILVWMPLLIVVTVISFMARGIDADAGWMEIFGRLSYYFLSYSSGHIYAFSDWFDSITTGVSLQAYSSINESNGFYTFMSLFKILGTSKIAPPGVYDEYLNIGDVLQTNIYTHYRGLILDFGIFGSLIFMLLLGAFSNLMFYSLLKNKKPWFEVACFAHILGYFYTSFIISILIWNSMYASFIVVALILLLNRKMNSNNCTKSSRGE